MLVNVAVKGNGVNDKNENDGLLGKVWLWKFCQPGDLHVEKLVPKVHSRVLRFRKIVCSC